MTRVDDLAAAFADRTGAAPAGVWLAPGRVNLIGEHTDYNDGFAMPFAIDRTTLAAARLRDDGLVRVWSCQRDEVASARLDDLPAVGADVPGWARYPLGAAWAVAGAGGSRGGADLVVDGGVPEGGGLSSSAALLCACVVALADLGGPALAPSEAARLAQRAEVEVARAPVGVMDQLASMHGRAGHAVFIDTRSFAIEQVPFDPAAAGLELLVIDTKAPHAHAGGEYGARRASCERVATTLGIPALRDATLGLLEERRDDLDPVDWRRARHVVTEDDRVLAAVALLRTGRLGAIGPLLDASHASLRDDYEVSCPELDCAVDAARAAGAIGARMTGGGFGGSAIALLPAGTRAAVGAAVVGAFAARGFAAPALLDVRASDGARRIA